MKPKTNQNNIIDRMVAILNKQLKIIKEEEENGEEGRGEKYFLSH